MGTRQTPMLGILFLLCWAATGQAEYIKYKDPNQPVNVRVKDLMKRMTLAEKIGQMTQIERKVATPQVLKDYFIGERRWQMHSSCLCTARRDPDLVKKIGVATALEIRATGIPYTFAPCIAVCRDPRWGRCFESYSEDHRVVQAMNQMILGLQGDIPANYTKKFPYVAGKNNVAACAKHFVGDGGTHKGINENNTLVDFRGLRRIHMPAYYDSIAMGVSTVMLSFSSWRGVKMHAHRFLVTDFLKKKLGFKVMVPEDYLGFINNLTTLVHAKVIPKSRINDAVRRILRVKFVMGLFENPLPDYSLVDQLGKKVKQLLVCSPSLCLPSTYSKFRFPPPDNLWAASIQEHRELSREAVRKSLVLLKNGKSCKKPLLPLPKKARKILVAGSNADNLGLLDPSFPGTTILEAVRSTVHPSTKVVFSENPDAGFVKRNNFSYAIVVVGEPSYSETAGDNLNLTIPEPGPSTIRSVCGAVKCVVVIISGRPLVVEPYVPLMDALVAAWLPGTEGQGVADVLFGDFGFTGKLPRTWFKSVDQLPMNVGDENYDPLFPFDF
ncbi:hypothetical protein GW17_00039613, partial [Ensete ventricosum]